MHRPRLRIFALLSLSLFLIRPGTLRAEDAQPPAAVPKGEVTKYTFDQSKIFPGTVRDYWIYVPKQYDPAKPACLYVNQDGIQFNAPAVFDELIHKKEMPVVIGVFVTPGRVKAPSDKALDRFNRSLRIRRPRRQLRPVPARGAAARGGEEDDAGRPADPAVARRQRPLHRRLQQRRDLRLHGGLGAARRLPPRLQRDRHLRRPARRQRLPDADPQVRAEADPHLPAGRQQRPEHLRRRLVDGQPGDGACADLRRLRGEPRLGRPAATTASTATKIFPDAMRWLWKDWPAP